MIELISFYYRDSCIVIILKIDNKNYILYSYIHYTNEECKYNDGNTAFTF